MADGRNNDFTREREIVIQAMQAGLDAYIESPMCLTIRRRPHDWSRPARKYNRVTQIGTQQAGRCRSTTGRATW